MLLPNEYAEHYLERCECRARPDQRWWRGRRWSLRDLADSSAEFERDKSSEDYHNIYGNRAFPVGESALEDANTTSSVDAVGQSLGFFALVRRFLGVRRIADARNLLIATMEAEQREGHTITLTDGTKIKFGVDDAGNDGVRIDKNAKFYIWKVDKTQNKFVEPSASSS